MKDSSVAEELYLQQKDQEFIDGLISRHKDRPGMLLRILEEIQESQQHRYLPITVLDYLAGKIDLPRAQVYSVATFYSLFNLKPQGDHTICICRGTACHTHGSRSLLERLKLQLGLKEDGEEGSADKLSATTPDRRFTLRTVACFGQCALAPVVAIDGAIHSHVSGLGLSRLIKSIGKGAKK